MKRGDRIQAEDHVLGARERGCKHLQNSQDLAEMRRWSLKLLLAQDAASKEILYSIPAEEMLSRNLHSLTGHRHWPTAWSPRLTEAEHTQEIERWRL